MTAAYKLKLAIIALVCIGVLVATVVTVGLQCKNQESQDLENVELSRIWISDNILIIDGLLILELSNREILQFLDNEGNHLQWHVPDIQDTFDDSIIVLVKAPKDNVIYLRWKPI